MTAVTLDDDDAKSRFQLFGDDPCLVSQSSRNCSYPEHVSTGSRGYFGKLGFVTDS